MTAANDFLDVAGKRRMVFFYNAPPAPDLIAGYRDAKGERLALGIRELYVDYGHSIRFTKLKIPER